MATADALRRAGQVEYTRVALDELLRAPVNPRRGHVDSIRVSIRQHGQFAPLLVQRSTMMILKGNHTRDALIAEGYTEADVGLIDVDDDEAQRIILVDNRTSDKSTYDQQELAELLTAVANSTAGLVGTGWDPDEYDDLLAALDAMPVLDEQSTDAAWAYDDETLAKRTAQRQASMGDTALHEVTLYFKSEDFERYKNAVKILQKHYGDVSAAEATVTTLCSHPATQGNFGEDGLNADTFIAATDGD